METNDKIEEFLNKVKKLEKGEKLDLSSGEDLSIGVMNLISIEEHFFFTYNKTKDSKYLNLLDEVREMRKELMKRIIKDYEGEVWCISKHLLAVSMRLMEVGTKSLTKGNKKEAADLFQKSYKLYSLFWGLNLGLIKTADIKKNNSQTIDFINDKEKNKIKGSINIFAKLGQVIEKVLNCCRE